VGKAVSARDTEGQVRFADLTLGSVDAPVPAAIAKTHAARSRCERPLFTNFSGRNWESQSDRSGSVVATAPGGVQFGQYKIPAGSGVDMHRVRRRGAETDTSPTARRVLLHLDSQVAHACFAQ
jgi:hypothetical protein